MPSEAGGLSVKPRRGCWILIAPIVMIGTIIGSYMLLGVFALIGGNCDGERVTLEVRGCEQSFEVIKHRVKGMGLCDPTYERKGQTLSMTLTLPDNEEAKQIPATLTQAGLFSIKDQAGRELIGNEDFIDASPSVGLLGESMLVLEIKADLVNNLRVSLLEAQEVTAYIDGVATAQVAASHLNKQGQLKIIPTSEGPELQALLMARATILLSAAPMECETALLP